MAASSACSTGSFDVSVSSGLYDPEIYPIAPDNLSFNPDTFSVAISAMELEVESALDRPSESFSGDSDFSFVCSDPSFGGSDSGGGNDAE